ncbi:hypothetical protein HGRIS_014863 [Hohenbuehelia grisea]|uniref:Transcription activator GCR1-like domain-containing protein n=1 Tax=Hohenbuehelia grisea TaxID=104357 RepID=A0ABR3IR21_9AGAR
MTIQDIWQCFNMGEATLNTNGEPTGMKPPLCLVEQYLKANWRKGPNERKAWERFREIPEFIDGAVTQRGRTPSEAVKELEMLRVEPGKHNLLGTSALVAKLKENRRQAAKNSSIPTPPSSSPPPTSPPHSSSAPTAPLTTSPSSINKRRAPAYGARPRAKRAKTS